MKYFYEITKINSYKNEHIAFMRSIKNVRKFLESQYLDKPVEVKIPNPKNPTNPYWKSYNTIYDIPNKILCNHIFERGSAGYHKNGFEIIKHSFED